MPRLLDRPIKKIDHSRRRGPLPVHPEDIPGLRRTRIHPGLCCGVVDREHWSVAMVFLQNPDARGVHKAADMKPTRVITG